MRVKKVVLDYSGLSDDELNTLVGKVLDCLTGHATFTALPLELEDFEAEVLDFRAKWQAEEEAYWRLPKRTMQKMSWH